MPKKLAAPFPDTQKTFVVVDGTGAAHDKVF